MSDFEQMPMEPEHQENLFIQILQEKLDLMSSEFGGLSIPVKILIGVFIVMVMAVTAFAIYYSYNNWDKIKKTVKKVTTDIKKKVTGLKPKTNQKSL